jgi:hypothetical protein
MPNKAEFLWVERERRYFISNASYLEPGTIIEKSW